MIRSKKSSTALVEKVIKERKWLASSIFSDESCRVEHCSARLDSRALPTSSTRGHLYATIMLPWKIKVTTWPLNNLKRQEEQKFVFISFFHNSKSFPVSHFFENSVLPDDVKLLSCQVVTYFFHGSIWANKIICILTSRTYPHFVFNLTGIQKNWCKHIQCSPIKRPPQTVLHTEASESLM